jgi:2-oxoglutarate ferredoxin oxidoreductase subunit beta
MTVQDVEPNIVERYLRMDRMPHMWCPGCGIGTTVNCFVRAIEECGIPRDKIAIVSGIGCTGRVAGYIALDSFHTTHGRAIPFATGLKLARPDMNVVVYSGDGDLIAIGGNHLIHAARRNADLKIICINNFTYAMTGGQVGPTSPRGSLATTAPYGSFEQEFNLPFLAESSGAVYVARWTSYHVRQITRSMVDCLKKNGITFLEIIAPCPTLYGRRNRLGTGLDLMKSYKEVCVIKHGANTKEVAIVPGKEIIVGRFVNVERPTFLDSYNEQMKARLGESYRPYEGVLSNSAAV